jgi:hypothetical protein
VSLDGPALSVVLRVTRREDAKRPEIRRKSARDQGLERGDARLRGGAAGGVPVLQGGGPAARWSAGDRGARAGGASGAGAARAWAGSGAGAGAAPAVSLPSLRSGAGRGAARALATTLVQRWGDRVGVVGVRRGCEQRERAGSDEPVTGGGRVSRRALGDSAAVGRGGSGRCALRGARADGARAAQRRSAGRTGARSSRRTRARGCSRGESLHRRGDRGVSDLALGRAPPAGGTDSTGRRRDGIAIHRGRSGTRRVEAGKRS